MHETEDAPLVFMVTVFDRKYEERITDIFTGDGVAFNLLTLGRGTANSKISGYLGLGETEKTILFSTMSLKLSKAMLKKLGGEKELNEPGHGIAFTLPIGSVYDAETTKSLQDLSQTEEGGDTIMEEKSDHDLIIAITNRGFSDEVMDAAKNANAKGGTVINARGTSLRDAEKFFGVMIQPEKEVIMILTQSEFKSGIMESIASRAGLQTDARTLVFSLPVNGVARISGSFEEQK